MPLGFCHPETHCCKSEGTEQRNTVSRVKSDGRSHSVGVVKEEDGTGGGW